MAATLTPYPDFARFQRAIERFVAEKRLVGWRGDVFRFAHPKYAEPADFVSGVGAKLQGARWTPPGGHPTLYAATSPLLATRETFGLSRQLGFPPRNLLPRVIRAISVTVSELVDVTNGEIRTSLGVSRSRMLETDWRTENANGREALTQAIGRAVADAGLEGLIVPSIESPEESDLALFMTNLRARSRAELVE